MSLTFEWDETKAKWNFRKHGVSFEEAKTIFNDPFAITINDPGHSDSEDHFLDIGQSAKTRVLVVWYIERGENIRIIGSRKTTRAERRSYEKENQL
jgi:uncharacterized protein